MLHNAGAQRRCRDLCTPQDGGVPEQHVPGGEPRQSGVGPTEGRPVPFISQARTVGQTTSARRSPR